MVIRVKTEVYASYGVVNEGGELLSMATSLCPAILCPAKMVSRLDKI